MAFFWRNARMLCYLSRQLLAFCLPQNVCKGIPCNLWKTISSRITFRVKLMKRFFNQTSRGQKKVFRFDWFFWSGFLQSRANNQHFWSLHRSSVQVDFQGKAVLVLVHKHRWALCSLSSTFPWILTLCWLTRLLGAAFSLYLASQTSWGYRFFY